MKAQKKADEKAAKDAVKQEVSTDKPKKQSEEEIDPNVRLIQSEPSDFDDL